MAAEKPLLFFSNKCEYSILAVQKIITKNLVSKFILICIDDKLDRIPRYVRQVPALVEPGKTEILTGSTVFSFIDNMKLAEISQAPIEPYSDIEHSGRNLTDSFAYISNTGSVINSMNAPHNFKSVDTPQPSSRNYTMAPKDNPQIPMRDYLGEKRPMIVDMRPQPSTENVKRDQYDMTSGSSSRTEGSRKDDVAKRFEEMQRERDRLPSAPALAPPGRSFGQT
jgi:hypothetical protein